MKKRFRHIMPTLLLLLLACSWQNAGVTLPQCENEKEVCQTACENEIPCCEGKWIQIHSDLEDAFQVSKIQSTPTLFGLTHPVFFVFLEESIDGRRVSGVSASTAFVPKRAHFIRFQNFRL